MQASRCTPRPERLQVLMLLTYRIRRRGLGLYTGSPRGGIQEHAIIRSSLLSLCVCVRMRVWLNPVRPGSTVHVTVSAGPVRRDARLWGVSYRGYSPSTAVGSGVGSLSFHDSPERMLHTLSPKI